jgi:hypothetical protein
MLDRFLAETILTLLLSLLGRIDHHDFALAFRIAASPSSSPWPEKAGEQGPAYPGHPERFQPFR